MVMDPWQNLKQTSLRFELHHHLIMQCSLSLTPRPIKTPLNSPRLKGWGLLPTLKLPGPEQIGAHCEGGAIAPMGGSKTSQEPLNAPQRYCVAHSGKARLNGAITARSKAQHPWQMQPRRWFPGRTPSPLGGAGGSVF